MLGRGSQGIVYKARENTNGLDVVLKFVLLKGTGSRENAKALQEADMLQSFQHENIVRCWGSFKHGDFIVIKMCVTGSQCLLFCDVWTPCPLGDTLGRELCAHGSLEELISPARRGGRPLPEAVILKIAGATKHRKTYIVSERRGLRLIH